MSEETHFLRYVLQTLILVMTQILLPITLLLMTCYFICRLVATKERS